ncbi:hypothetical protein JTE90_007415 [Oedothorax gibbosus]|uniref:Uncharacterized protein n=1 Tax=Oedothorax gibbosus TaxID=931172 RepID=A0AAV6TQP5_9ARAC|nr:hypothetical protein JTE90_007415 [Oedothorax gibbosus]
MDALTTRKPYLKGQVTRLTNNVQALGDTTVQIVRLKHYREQATTLVGKVTALYEELLALVEKTDYETTEQEFHGELNSLDELIISIDGLLTSNAAQPASSNNHANGSSAAVRLPRIESCTSGGCRTCGQKHNTLLHIHSEAPEQSSVNSSPEQKQQAAFGESSAR